MRLALLLLAFSLPALAAPPCDGPEPKDVACIMKHDRNAEDARSIRYQWREAGLPADVFCGVRDPEPAYRIGRDNRPARLAWNPYQFDGPCFPPAGETKVYRVRACWVSTGICSANWSNSVTVIGVPAAEMRCCSSTSCGGC